LLTLIVFADRKWLSNFIIGCKYNLQRSKQVIESYFIARAEYPEFFGSFTREQLVEAAKNGQVILYMYGNSSRVKYFILTSI